MISPRNKHIVLWTASLAFAGAVLCLKGVEPSMLSRLSSLLTGSAIGALIGFGFGMTFVRPRSTTERRLKIIYSTATFGIVGAVVGMADPGIRPVVVATLVGMIVGCGVGLLVFLTACPSADESPKP